MVLTSSAQRKTDTLQRQLLVARSLAIEDYAVVEQTLCDLFSYVSDTNPLIAGTIFFRLTNANSRLAILQTLLKQKHHDVYSLFFNSLCKTLKSMDGDRNEIVHWHTMVGVENTDGEIIPTRFILKPPNYWAHDANTPNLDAGRLDAFGKKCRFLTHTIQGFVDLLNERVPLTGASPDIFHAELTYPPPAAHPSFSLLQIIESLPRP